MNRVIAGALLIFAVTISAPRVSARAADHAPLEPTPVPDSFWRKVVRFSGIGANPSMLKAPEDEIHSGQIWLFDLTRNERRRMTAGDGFRSPVFMPYSNDILALSGEEVVRLSPTGGEPKKLYRIKGITKLVGLSMDVPDQALVLTGSEERVGVGLLSITSGKVAPLVYDRGSSEDRQIIQHLRSWDRIYGEKRVYVKRETRESLAGEVEWTDVFLKTGTQSPVNISKCEGAECGQPSLSADGTLLVFINSGSTLMDHGRGLRPD